MINSERLALSGFPEFLAADYSSFPTHPRRKFFFWRLLSALMIILLVFLCFPRQAAYEVSLSPASFLALVNQDRLKENLKPLRMNNRLTRAAYAKAEHMLQNGYFSHVSPEGIEPWDFIKEQDFAYTFAGENLAINYTSAYELENDFLQSPSHRENLLSPAFTQTGIAVLEGILKGSPVLITVQFFAMPVSGNISLSR